MRFRISSDLNSLAARKDNSALHGAADTSWREDLNDMVFIFRAFHEGFRLRGKCRKRPIYEVTVVSLSGEPARDHLYFIGHKAEIARKINALRDRED